MTAWLVLLGMALGFYPLGRLLRGRVALLSLAMTLLGFAALLPPNSIDVNLWNHPHYRGEARGLAVTLLDFVLLVLAVALPPARTRRPYPLSRALYLAVVLGSIALAPRPLFSLFSLGRLVEGYLALVVVTRACEHPGRAEALVRGLLLGLVWLGISALRQRYQYGVHQCDSGIGHPNSLAMAVNVLYPIALALLLAGHLSWLAGAAIIGSALAVQLALSRGGLLMFALGTALTFLGSFARRVSLRKVGIAVLMALLGGAMALRSYHSIEERFRTAPPESLESRRQFVDAASMILRDHPLGVGINQYSWVQSREGYDRLAHLGPLDRDGIVHNTYWLTLAELGYHGLAAYLLVLALPLGTALRGAARRQRQRDARGDVMLGCAVGLITMYVHSFAEWIPRQSLMIYLFWIVAGLSLALERQGRAPRG